MLRVWTVWVSHCVTCKITLFPCSCNESKSFLHKRKLIKLLRPNQAEEFDLLQNLSGLVRQRNLFCFKIFQASQAEEFDLLWMTIYGLFLGSGQLNLWTPMPLPLVIQSRSNSSAWLAWKILKQIKFLCLYWLKQPFKAEPYGILSLMIYKWVSLYTTL